MINDTLLDGMRQSGDPLADAVIGDFLGAGEIPELNAMLGKLHANMSDPAGFPPRLAAYLEESARLPAWADPARIERAQRLFTLHGPVFGLVMLFKSLPILYAGGKGGSQVLAMTGQLHNHYRRRASETLRFILDVMEPGGLGPSGKGIRTAQKVRLMHAAIRAYASAAPGWKGRLPAWGLPINQEELAGTLLAFSTVTLDGVRAMGLSVSRKDAEAYLHAWEVIGHILGIDPRLYPRDTANARFLWKAVARRNFCRTEEGLMLIRDHQEFLAELIPSNLIDRSIPTLLRYLMGRKISDTVLDLPKSSAPYTLLLFLMEIFHLEKLGFLIFPGLVRWARGASIHLMEAFQAYLKVGRSKPFHVPAGLTKH
ncbi:MAG TPA: oxygenase MpaB family protein [Fibrobacteria bacterium]|nr:oxygenase MpaB family protein [Fibrobacteria bacterium]